MGSYNKNNIQISDEFVTKRCQPALMAIEFTKHTRAIEIAEKSQLFRVPLIKEYLPEEGKLVLEYIPNLDRLSKSPILSERHLQKLAKALNAVHQGLILPDSMVLELPAKLSGPKNVFLHGDFNGENVCIDRSNGELVILDWQMTSVYGGDCTFGSRLFDLLWFCTYGLWEPEKKDIFDLNRPIELAMSFLQAYIQESDCGLTYEEVFKYAKKFYGIEYSKRHFGVNIRKNILLVVGRKLNKQFLSKLGQM